MSSSGFRFPAVAELDAYAEQRATDRAWEIPCLEEPRVQQPPWRDADEALTRSAFADPISIMITFLRIGE